jgi:hypothetical protein
MKMRNPNRLYSFYNQLLMVHVDKFPDIRFGQLIFNFSAWLKNDKKIDIFFLEEDDFIKYFKEYSGWGDEYI